MQLTKASFEREMAAGPPSISAVKWGMKQVSQFMNFKRNLLGIWQEREIGSLYSLEAREEDNGRSRQEHLGVKTH